MTSETTIHSSLRWHQIITGLLFYTTSGFVHHLKAINEFKLELLFLKHPIRVKIDGFFVLRDLENWQMTFKNNRASLLCYFKLCASFRSHCWIQTGVTVQKRTIRVKIDELFCPDWPGNLTDDLENRQGTSSMLVQAFMHHFTAIGQFKLELQSKNPQFGSKSMLFLSRVNWKFDRWPWKPIGHHFYATSSFCIISSPFVNSNWNYSPEVPNSAQNQSLLTDNLEKQ